MNYNKHSEYDRNYEMVMDYLKYHPYELTDNFDMEDVKDEVCSNLFNIENYEDADVDISYAIHNAVEDYFDDIETNDSENQFKFWVKRYGKPGDVEIIYGADIKDAINKLDNDEYVDWYDYYNEFSSKTYDPQETVNESLTESIGNPTEEEIIDVIVKECGYDRENAEQIVNFGDFKYYYGAKTAADVAKDIYEQAYDDEYMIDHYFKDKEYKDSFKETIRDEYPEFTEEEIEATVDEETENDKENWRMYPREIPNWVKEDYYDFDAMGQDLLAGNLYETSIGFIEIF